MGRGVGGGGGPGCPGVPIQGEWDWVWWWGGVIGGQLAAGRGEQGRPGGRNHGNREGGGGGARAACRHAATWPQCPLSCLAKSEGNWLVALPSSPGIIMPSHPILFRQCAHGPFSRTQAGPGLHLDDTNRRPAPRSPAPRLRAVAHRVPPPPPLPDRQPPRAHVCLHLRLPPPRRRAVVLPGPLGAWRGEGGGSVVCGSPPRPPGAGAWLHTKAIRVPLFVWYFPPFRGSCDEFGTEHLPLRTTEPQGSRLSFSVACHFLPSFPFRSGCGPAPPALPVTKNSVWPEPPPPPQPTRPAPLRESVHTTAGCSMVDRRHGTSWDFSITSRGPTGSSAVRDGQ